jgi:hypothetical protein
LKTQFYLTLVLRRLSQWARLPPGPRARRLIGELYRQLGQAEVTAERSGSTDAYWDAKRVEFTRQLLTHDPRRFASLAPVAETMFIDYPPYVERELERLENSADWTARWKPALKEPQGLRLPPCPYHPASSGNRIHHANHLMAWEAFANAKVGDLRSVLEFGGGYGGMAALAHSLGFRGRYYIYDLPELSALQEFFLRSNGIDAGPPASGLGVSCLSDYAALEPLSQPGKLDLFIATWSLSETPIPFRRDLLGRLRPRYWLIAYQENFQAYDNDAFFREWCAEHAQWRWKKVAADLIPGRHHYLFGALNDGL